MTALDALSEAIDVMARLRGPGGCPWDAEQTHASLVTYAIEEAHEVAQAVESGTPEELQEELGDLLLQVLFHAEIAAEEGTFTLADVATTLVAKLRRRHPHVFADAIAQTPEEVERTWAAIKAEERPRTHPLEGIPVSLPALMRAQKVLSRARKAGLEPAPTGASEPNSREPVAGEAVAGEAGAAAQASAESIGAELLSVVRKAQAAGIDAEQALRGATRGLEEAYDLPPSP